MATVAETVEMKVCELIRLKARHKKKGTVMGEEDWKNVFDHFIEELRELNGALVESYDETKSPSSPHVLEELGDLYGILVHAVLKAGFSMQQVEEVELAKLDERFEINEQAPVPDGLPSLGSPYPRDNERSGTSEVQREDNRY